MIKRIFCVLAALLLLVSVSVSAETSNEIKDFSVSVEKSKLTDNKVSSYVKTDKIVLENISGTKYLYLIFYDEACAFSVTYDGQTVTDNNRFLESFVTLGSAVKGTAEIKFEKEINLSEIRVFGSGEIPSSVHRWEKYVDKADLLLVATHSDDDQLFFAGLLPYYAGEKGYSVQVAYFIDHNKNVIRRHELLSGLWTSGVTSYPVISSFPDEYSESGAEALNNLKKYGIEENDLIEWQSGLIERFKPLVVVGHDLNGEYGHGQHILNAETLIKGIENAADTHTVQKLYLHLYNENKITMNYDIPLEKFGGQTAFEVAKQGFSHHKTQHQYWFYDWLNESEKASDIKKYSPCEFGLYKTAVGYDTGNDMFENIKTYTEREKEKNETPPPVPEPEAEIKPAKNYTGHVVIIVLLIVFIAVINVIKNKIKVK